METKDEQFEQSASNFQLQQVTNGGTPGTSGTPPGVPDPPRPPRPRRVLQNEGHKLYKDLKGFVGAMRGGETEPGNPGRREGLERINKEIAEGIDRACNK